MIDHLAAHEGRVRIVTFAIADIVKADIAATETVPHEPEERLAETVRLDPLVVAVAERSTVDAGAHLIDQTVSCRGEDLLFTLRQVASDGMSAVVVLRKEAHTQAQPPAVGRRQSAPPGLRRVYVAAIRCEVIW